MLHPYHPCTPARDAWRRRVKMEEHIYLQTQGISITSARITIGSQTFATRNVGSVRLEETQGARWPWAVMLLGALMAASPSARFMGVVVLALGAFAAWSNRSKYKLVLIAGGGEVSAYADHNRQAIELIHEAIVKAISVR